MQCVLVRWCLRLFLPSFYQGSGLSVFAFNPLLKNLPDREAREILQRIRSSTDIATILNHVAASDLLLQMHVVPESRSRYEFPYQSEMPEEYIPSNPYLDLLLFEAASLYPIDKYSNLPAPHSSSLLTELSSNDYQNLYLKPFHAAQVVDPLLSDVRISSWTAVCDDNILMRDLLGVFFRREYHFAAAFQTDYFLEDMMAQREDFCPSLLVNIILAYACVRIFYVPCRGSV